MNAALDAEIRAYIRNVERTSPAREIEAKSVEMEATRLADAAVNAVGEAGFDLAHDAASRSAFRALVAVLSTAEQLDPAATGRTHGHAQSLLQRLSVESFMDDPKADYHLGKHASEPPTAI